MKKIIKESDLKRIIKGVVAEALKYDKERRQYFPQYTGDPHRDAGSYEDNYRDDYNYTRNEYQWSNPDAQKKFQDKQWDNDLEIDPMDPDRDNEADAQNYRNDRDPFTITNKAIEDTKGDFYSMLSQFLDGVKQKYPLFNNPSYMSDFIWKLRDELDDYEY